jgi:hypothetical protein
MLGAWHLINSTEACTYRNGTPQPAPNCQQMVYNRV